MFSILRIAEVLAFCTSFDVLVVPVRLVAKTQEAKWACCFFAVGAVLYCSTLSSKRHLTLEPKMTSKRCSAWPRDPQWSGKRPRSRVFYVLTPKDNDIAAAVVLAEWDRSTRCSSCQVFVLPLLPLLLRCSCCCSHPCSHPRSHRLVVGLARELCSAQRRSPALWPNMTK
jgi:hypothetical protein